MSEPKLVSPLLDGFIMGEAISDHHGVRCCPAIRENTDERYIVKIISIPASQVQLDALLLTGAYSDQAEALAYFKELSDGVVGEADILDRLSRLEGFVPYLGHQIQLMDDGVGYDVYLIGHYKRSLNKLMRTEPLTHLAAVNMGLDMCAALAVCRRAGYLYADLKPSNIFLSDMQGYHIGDLGFIPLSSLKYASLPEKYRSSYTAPEITDAMSVLNDTIDIYALGLTLYQVYNNGELPFEGNAPAQVLPPPMYADYEMAEIILKACAPDPKDRWQDPAQMGHALVNYMQRNSVNDTPIVPPPVTIEDEPEETEQFLTEEENDAEMAELLAMIPDEEPPAQEPETCDNKPGQAAEEDSTVTEPEIPAVEDDSAEELVEEEPNEVLSQELPTEEEPTDEEISAEPEPAFDEEPVQLSFLDILTAGETAPSEENAATLHDTPVTDEVAQMLAQADDLIAHELPEPVVAPDPIDVPIPPPIVPEPEVEEETQEHNDEHPSELPLSEAPEESTEDGPETAEEEPQAEEPADEEDEPEEIWDDEETPRKKASVRRLIAAAIIALLLAALGIGGYWFYNHYYLQTIDALDVLGSDDALTVQITSDVDDKLLTVICTDTYGNAKRAAVSNGIAVFSDLNPGTQYRITMEISGLHKLTGNTSGSYTTAAQTEILNFSAIIGPEDGSVILSFSVNGPDSDHWTLAYSAPGEDVRMLDFTGHTATVTGLTVDSEYTFLLVQPVGIHLADTYELTYTAKKIVYAQDLKVTSCGNGSMTVQWALSEDTDTQNWLVRCYNDAGYDQTLTTTETSIEFTGLDHTTGYTILVTAEG
ncbi:MAG: protein kinase, partial [Oscillospiraceae bacterium]|nr:protein kinase [Oscillospiraceae bacterium]